MEIVAAVLEVLNDHDPEGLLAMGAPTDEYDAEAAELAVLIPREPPPMEADVEEVWRRWFGEHHALLGGELASGQLPVGRLDGPIGVLTIPGALMSLDSDLGRRYVRSGRETLGLPACGWVIDVRGNSGGDIGPMLSTLGPLLGPGPAVTYRDRDGDSATFHISDAGSLQVATEGSTDEVPGANHPFVPVPGAPPVAILQGFRTGSSGEGVVMAFRGRPWARTFGTATYGVPTGVTGHELSDGSVLAVTEAAGVDAGGTLHTGPIPPDQLVPTDEDAFHAARAWLLDQNQCR